MGDLIGGLKPDAVDVPGQPVRVGADLLDGIVAIGLVDAHRAARADPVAVEEDHNLADYLLLRPRILDPPPAFGADAVHVLQPGGLLFDDVEYLLAELRHQLPGIHGADAFHHAAAQIFLDPFPGGGRGAVEHVGAELAAKLPVMDPVAFGRDPFPGAHRSQGANHGHQVAVSRSFHFEHGPTVLLIEERHPLDQAGEAFRLS